MKLNAHNLARSRKNGIALGLGLVSLLLFVGLIIAVLMIRQRDSQIASLGNGGVALHSNLYTLTSQKDDLTQKLDSKSSDYDNLSKAVLNDPAHSDRLNQIFTDLKNKKLIVPPGSKCNPANMLDPFNLPAAGAQATPTQNEQAASTSDCLKIIDNIFLGSYVDAYKDQ